MGRRAACELPLSCLLVAELKALQAEEILAFLPRKVELRAVRIVQNPVSQPGVPR